MFFAVSIKFNFKANVFWVGRRPHSGNICNVIVTSALLYKPGTWVTLVRRHR